VREGYKDAHQPLHVTLCIYLTFMALSASSKCCTSNPMRALYCSSAVRL
jgi:hypothetical protein